MTPNLACFWRFGETKFKVERRMDLGFGRCGYFVQARQFSLTFTISHTLQAIILVLDVNELKEGKRQKSGEYGNC